MTERRTSILSARAQALLQALPAGFEQVSSLAVIVFSMGEERAGVRLSSAREVVPVGQMAAIPGAPPYLRGLAQVRGELLCVLDLLAFWRPGRQTAGGHLIVVESSAGAMALLADAIEDVRDIDSGELAAALSEAASEGRKGIECVTRDLVLLLDIEALLGRPELRVDHGRAPEKRESGNG